MQSQDQRSNNDGTDTVYFLVNAHATAIAVLIRKDFGAEALEVNAYAIFGLLFLYAGTADPLVGLYFLIFLACQVKQRFRTSQLIRGGNIIHSRYAGYPHVAMQFPFVQRESTAKGIVEPIMCLVAGTAIYPLSHNLGWFILLGSMSFLVREAIDREIIRKRLERMHDAEIEQRYLTYRYKNPRVED